MSYVDQAHTPPYKLTAMPKSSPPAPSGLSSEHDFLPSLYLSDGLATPFTTPGPFAHTTHKFSDDFADLRSSSSRASSASRTIAATRANSPDAFISVADILPYSTPGPLAVQTRSSSSYHMLNPDLTLRSPLLRDSLHLVPMETLQDDLTSSSPDLLADVPLAHIL
ncbi:hypothetical protein BC835DRAFT_849113 [Cytidiella melzeri]|nr:hypothetical protein BC835DRAFT_849113 [Cytidiella melzeri]